MSFSTFQLGKKVSPRADSLMAAGPRIDVATRASHVADSRRGAKSIARRRSDDSGSSGTIIDVKTSVPAYAYLISELVDSGAIRPVIDQIFGFSDRRQALARFRDARHVGKIVIRMP